MWQRLSISLLLLGFSIQSLAVQINHETQKFFLKSLVDPHIDNYYPLRISVDLDENFFKNSQLNKTIKAATDTTIKILSDLVLSKPSKAGLKFGEKIQCDDFLIHQIIKSQGIDADFGLYITSSSDNEDNLIMIKKCENGSQLFVVSVAINLKKFLALEEYSQVKKLSSAIAGIIFEDNSHRNQLLSEIEDYIEYLPKLSASGCNPQIDNCVICKPQTPSICFNCSASYLPNEDGTQCCAGQYCKTCNTQWLGCDSCIDNYIFTNGGCYPCPTNCAECNTTACVECNPGFYVEEGTMCLWCDTGCEICHAGPLSGSICTQCYDQAHSQLIDGECSCIKANQIYNEENICVCAPGYYEDSDGICQPCNIGCDVCTSPSQCTTCFDKNFTILNEDGSCSCKTNELTYNTTTHTCDCSSRAEYPDPETGLCDPCQDTCAWCLAYDICFECINPQILYNTGDGNCTCMDESKIYNISTNTCGPCPDGKYGFQGTCYECASPCATCSYYNECTGCSPGMHLLTPNQTCVCDDPTAVFNPFSKNCDACTTDNCTCSDPSKVYDPTTKTCISCPNGEFASNGECLQCASACLTCSSVDKCTQCYSGMYLSSNSSCECNDPDQIFDPSTHTCGDCPQGNCTCSDPTKVWDPNTQSCVSCPIEEYALNGVCYRCQSTCYTCLNSTGCTQCYPGMHLSSNSTCECDDPSQTFNPTTNTCGDCPQGNCTCSDPSQVYDPLTKSCVSCPNGKFAYHGICYPCESSCLTCSSISGGCEECYHDMHLSDNSTCECDDPLKKFDPSTKTCGDCASSEDGCGNGCSEGCNVCSSSQTCQTCYDYENMVNQNGVCSCVSPNQKFSISEKKCVDNSSAKGLALVWILALYAAI